MTPQEKAKDLVGKFGSVEITFEGQLGEIRYDEVCEAPKQCALICVDEIIRLANRPDLFKMRTKFQHMEKSTVNETYVEYWDEVKQEIEKL